MDRANGIESAREGGANAPAVDDASGREAAACRQRRRSKEPSRTDESDASNLSRSREVPGTEQKSQLEPDRICTAHPIESRRLLVDFLRRHLGCRPGFR